VLTSEERRLSPAEFSNRLPKLLGIELGIAEANEDVESSSSSSSSFFFHLPSFILLVLLTL
jgi:hypothetical protein